MQRTYSKALADTFRSDLDSESNIKVNLVNDSVQSDYYTDDEMEEQIPLDDNVEPVLVDIDDDEEDEEGEGDIYGYKLIECEAEESCGYVEDTGDEDI